MKKITTLMIVVLSTSLFSGCGLFNRKKKLTEAENPYSFFGFQSGSFPVFFSRQEGKVASVALVFLGGKVNYSREVEGIEYLALRMAIEGGTLMYSPDERRKRAEELGAKITLRTGEDHSALILTCPAENLPRAWDFFVQAILTPAFEETVFSRIRDAHFRMLMQSKNSPGQMTEAVGMDSLFSGTAYGKNSIGSTDGMMHYSLKETREYFSGLCTQQHLMLVICGKTDTGMIRERITETLTDLPEGYLAPFPEFEFPQGKCIEFFTDKGPQVARCIFSSPPCGSAESAQLEFALGLVKGRMNATGMMQFNCGLSQSRVPFAWMQFSAAEIGPALREFSYQIRSVVQEGFFEPEIEAKRELWISSKYFIFQDPAKVTESAAQWISAGNTDPVLVSATAIRNSGKAEIDRVFRKAFVNPSWVFAGDTSSFEAPIIPIFAK